MSRAVATVRSITASVLKRIAAAGRRRADAHAQAICPVDSWTFTPLYTDGSCPLCGWAPDGYEYAPPLLTPYDRYWGALGGIAALSVAMCVAVAIALTKA